VRKALVWCAGDVTNYIPLTYKVNEKEVKTSLAPAALNEVNDYDSLITIIPETLFIENHEENYKLLLKAKSHYEGYYLTKGYSGEDKYIHKLLEKGFKAYKVVHPGIARPFKVKIENKAVYTEGSEEKTFKASFNALLNTVYSVLRQTVLDEKVDEIHVDLTHGTNILVNALMLASQIIAETYETKTRLWAAPVLTRPEEEAIVEYIEITQSSKIAREVLAGTVAWKKLDERILPTQAVSEIGRVLGPLLRDLYGDIKTLTKIQENILWGLRSGQAAVLHPYFENTSHVIENVQEKLSKIIYDYYLKTLPEDLKLSDTPWLPIADTILRNSTKLLSKTLGKTPLETTINILKLYHDTELYDKIVCIARELIIVLLARKILKNNSIEIAGEKWKLINIALNIIKLKDKGYISENNEDKKEKINKEKLEKYKTAISKILSNDEISTLNKITSLRNKLMHGRYSIEENVIVTLNDGKLVSANTKKEIKLIDKNEIAENCYKIIAIIDKIT